MSSLIHLGFSLIRIVYNASADVDISLGICTFDIFFGIKLLIMIALGGMHYIWGAIIGAVIITFLSYEWLHYFEELEILVYGAILLIVTIFLPQGLAGIPAIVKHWFRRTLSDGSR